MIQCLEDAMVNKNEAAKMALQDLLEEADCQEALAAVRWAIKNEKYPVELSSSWDWYLCTQRYLDIPGENTHEDLDARVEEKTSWKTFKKEAHKEVDPWIWLLEEWAPKVKWNEPLPTIANEEGPLDC